MHFTVLSALPLPQDTSAAMHAVPVDDVVSFVAGKLLLENLASQKPVKMPEVFQANRRQTGGTYLGRLGGFGKLFFTRHL